MTVLTFPNRLFGFVRRAIRCHVVLWHRLLKMQKIHINTVWGIRLVLHGVSQGPHGDWWKSTGPVGAPAAAVFLHVCSRVMCL